MDPENSLRGDIEAALGGDGASTESPTPEQTPTPEPSSPAPAPAPAPESGAPAQAAAKGDRDSLGRFLPKDAVQSPVAPESAAAKVLGREPVAASAPGAASIPAPAAPVDIQPPA